jgi:hypothetical protein
MSNTLRRDPVCSCPITIYRGLRIDANELWLNLAEKMSVAAIIKRAAGRSRYSNPTPCFLSERLAPTEVRCEFLKSSFYVVAVFLWSNRVIIRINMHREATRNPQMVPWGWGEGRKKIFYLSLIFYETNISI